MSWSRIDDLDRNAYEVEQVTIGVGGKVYVLDLGADNRRKLTTLLAPYVDVATEYADLPPVPPGLGRILARRVNR